MRYQVTLESNNRPWLLVLDASAMQPALPGYSLSMTPELQWVADRPIADIVRYSAQSHVDFRHGPLRASASLQDFVDLPPGFNPRTLALAAELRRDPRYADAGAPQLIEAVLNRLRTGGYGYTLDPGVFGQHTADEFWFDRKEGFCEHIASSFVVLMRALDVPARIVTGYQGGEQNAIDGFWIVRQRDAHAWAEVWVAGQGWVRVDPTSAVSPSRTGSFQRLQVPQGVLANALTGVVSPAFALNMRAMWDAMNNGWNQWVLNYTQGKQLDLLKNIGFESPGWEDLGYLLIGIIVALSLLGAAWTLWERSRHDPWLRLLEKAAVQLQKSGLTVPPNSGPRQLARLLLDRYGSADAQTRALGDWLLRLERFRYAPTGADRDAPRLVTLQRELKQISWPK